MANYNKKIRGLCFVEDVYDDKNVKRSNIIFDNNCELILPANKYLKHFRETQSGSYCTINRIARDLCCLYDFLLISGKSILNIDFELLREFVAYLKIIKVRRFNKFDKEFIKNKFSIERTLWNSVQKINNNRVKNNKVIQLREVCGLDAKSIFRIFNRTIIYLKKLHDNNEYFNEKIICYFQNEREMRDFLKAQGIEIRKHEIIPVTQEKILLEDEICEINKKCSTNYERFLYFMLEKTGIRIGEALGIQIIKYDKKDLRGIEGDLKFKDGRWTINICWRPENPFYCRTKSHRARSITLKESETQVFELLLERYLRWRTKKCSSEWLFISNRGNHLTENVAYSKFKTTLKKAGLENRSKVLTLHSYRHTFASRELYKGVPLVVISKILGHKNSKTTEEIYIHFTNKDITKMRENIDRKLEEDLNGNT